MKKTTLFLIVLLFSFNNITATIYEVGADKPYEHIYDVPLKNLEAGDIIKVYAKANQEPYSEKFMIYGQGTSSAPIQLIGIPDAEGNRPILDGENAVTGTEHGNYFWNEDRSLIKVGQTGSEAHYIIIDGFEIKNANRHYTFTNNQGQIANYLDNAAGIHIELGHNITVKNCVIHHNENGVQTSGMISNILLESCYIYDNGVGDNNSVYQHNIYVGGGVGTSVTIQYCKFGELLNRGQQVKFRTESVVFRYNWVEGGRNGQLDIVDGENGNINSYVYGNIIIKPADTENGRIVHYGQDIGNNDGGTLYFFNNTVIDRADATTYLFHINSENRKVVADNNIFYKINNQNCNLVNSAEEQNRISGNNNWLSATINDSNNRFSNSIVGETGENPGFKSIADNNFCLDSTASVINIVENYVFPELHNLTKEYVKDLKWKNRANDNVLDLGAYEYSSLLSAGNDLIMSDITVYPNPVAKQLFVETHKASIAHIYDINGKELQKLKLEKGTNKIDVSCFKSGVYVVRTECGSFKFVKSTQR